VRLGGVLRQFWLDIVHSQREGHLKQRIGAMQKGIALLILTR